MKIEVKLLDHMGNDDTVCQAAWVSSGRQSNKTAADKEKLIKYLADNKHETPFEHVQFTFHLRVPQRIGVQVIRHRTGKHNAGSARYGHKFTETFKSGYPELVELEQDAQNILDKYNHVLENIADYPPMVRRRIRECAAFSIPQGTMVEQIMTIDLRNLKNFLVQRLAVDAQPEIQEVAKQMKDHIELYLATSLSMVRKYYLKEI